MDEYHVGEEREGVEEGVEKTSEHKNFGEKKNCLANFLQ